MEEWLVTSVFEKTALLAQLLHVNLFLSEYTSFYNRKKQHLPATCWVISAFIKLKWRLNEHFLGLLKLKLATELNLIARKTQLKISICLTGIKAYRLTRQRGFFKWLTHCLRESQKKPKPKKQKTGLEK